MKCTPNVVEREAAARAGLRIQHKSTRHAVAKTAASIAGAVTPSSPALAALAALRENCNAHSAYRHWGINE